MDVTSFAFSKSALEEAEWPASSSVRYTHGKISAIRRWVGLEVDMDVVAKTELCYVWNSIILILDILSSAKPKVIT
jgi:hypothetical protein